MKKIFIYFFIFLCLHKATAQVNLVPNPSFETNNGCPTNNSQLYLAVPWVSPTTGFSEYFNACASLSSNVSVPSNAFGSYQYAKSGTGYAGFTTFNNTIINQREYLQVQLIDSLEKDQLYCVQFYVSLANNAQYTTSTIGAYFSKTAPTSSNYNALPYIPQVINSSANLLNDTLGWTLISGSFIAIGGEQYITIGNFNTDATSDTIFFNNNGVMPGAYYYIDSVTVMECSDTLLPPIVSSIKLPLPNIFTPNSDGINDVFTISSKNIKTLNCKIYNRWGILVGDLKNVNEGWDGRTTAGIQCTDGIYYYVLNAKGIDDIDYNQKGFVQLAQ